MHRIIMEITLLIMENHGIVFLNFCGNPGIFRTNNQYFRESRKREVFEI